MNTNNGESPFGEAIYSYTRAPPSEMPRVDVKSRVVSCSVRHGGQKSGTYPC